MNPLWTGLAGFLLLISGLLSAAEAAVFSVGPSRIRTLVDEGFDGADALAQARQRTASLQTAVHLLITILNLAVMGLIVAMGSGFGGAGTLVAIVAGALLLVVGVFTKRLEGFGSLLSLAVIGGAIVFHLSPWLGINAPVALGADGGYVHSPMLFGMAIVFGALSAFLTWMDKDRLPIIGKG